MRDAHKILHQTYTLYTQRLHHAATEIHLGKLQQLSSEHFFRSDTSTAIDRIFSNDAALDIASRRGKYDDLIAKEVKSTYEALAEKIRDEFTKLDARIEADKKKQKRDNDKAMEANPVHLLNEVLDLARPARQTHQS